MVFHNCHQLRLSGAQVNAQQRPVDYARKVGEGQPELSPIFDVCTKQPAVSPQDWPRRTAAAVRECSNRPRYFQLIILNIWSGKKTHTVGYHRILHYLEKMRNRRQFF